MRGGVGGGLLDGRPAIICMDARFRGTVLVSHLNSSLTGSVLLGNYHFKT